jgi:pimeloyl-ACP methyl ester carboxylesterase
MSLRPPRTGTFTASLLVVVATGTAFADPPRPGPREFRDIFYSYAAQSGKYKDADIEQLIYLSTDAMELGAGGVSSEVPAGDVLKNIDDQYRKLAPTSLYENGLSAKNPFKKVDADAYFKGRPVTIFVVPGIFGEFIQHTPFEEFFARTDSAYHRDWESALAHADPGNTMDAAFSLQRVTAAEQRGKGPQAGIAPVSLDKLLRVASYDAGGRALVQAVLLFPDFGSFETFGFIEDNASLYWRRIRKFLHIMNAAGKPIGEFYLLGYSRGTTVALEMAATAPADLEAGRLAGIIAHAGVIYGSPLADQADDLTKPMGQMIAELEGVRQDLKDAPDGYAEYQQSLQGAGFFKTQWLNLTNYRIRARAEQARLANAARWTSAVARLLTIVGSTPKHPELSAEKLQSSTPDPGSLIRLLHQLTFVQFDLDHFHEDHFDNVARFKVAFDKILAGARALSTSSRLDWWRSHTVPGNLRYFAVTGTMGDITVGGTVKPIVANQISYNRESVDYKSLRQNFYDLYDACKRSPGDAGIQLNDSQVPLDRARFWPHIHKVLNARQDDLRNTYFLGTVGEHHWGLSFPEAIDMTNRRVNPFPRSIFLQSMGAFVALAEGR